MLEDATTFEVLSLEPTDKPGQANGFHGFPIMGSVKIKEKKMQREIIAVIEQGIAEMWYLICASCRVMESTLLES